MIRFEQETILRFDEGSKELTLYTCSKRVARHMARAGIEPEKVLGESYFYTLSRKAIRIKPNKKLIYLGGK